MEVLHFIDLDGMNIDETALAVILLHWIRWSQPVVPVAVGLGEDWLAEHQLLLLF